MRKSFKRTYTFLLLAFFICILYMLLMAGRLDLPVDLIEDDIRLPNYRGSATSTMSREEPDKRVMPSGLPIGIYVKTKGVMVIDTGLISGFDGRLYSPCKDILKQGDYIISIDGQEINDKKTLVAAVDASGGRSVDIRVLRGSDELEYTISPVRNAEGSYKLGLWVKDDISGIGTLTFVDEEGFAALGHSINDNDTGIIFNISDGAIYNANLVNIVKPYDKTPGRLEGIIDYSADNIIGRVSSNTLYGITGRLNSSIDIYEYGEDWMNIAPKEEVRVGSAYILSAVSGIPEYYEVEITAVNTDERAISKSIELRITDGRLLAMTDGIVQGMSGTPIIQGGRLVGAITHVFVNDPTRGYGIFIEYMLPDSKND